MDEVTYFRGILPADGFIPDGSAFVPSPGTAGSDGLILSALTPLRTDLCAALARGQRDTALWIAYWALARVADALAAQGGVIVLPWQVRIHALLVTLESLPLEPKLDGTLVERGTAVQVSYRNWVVARSEAELWALSLAEQFRLLWPGAWIIMPAGIGQGVYGNAPVGSTGVYAAGGGYRG